MILVCVKYKQVLVRNDFYGPLEWALHPLSSHVLSFVVGPHTSHKPVTQAASTVKLLRAIVTIPKIWSLRMTSNKRSYEEAV